MKKLQIYVEQAVAITSSANEVTVPNFVVQGSIHIKKSGLATCSEKASVLNSEKIFSMMCVAAVFWLKQTDMY